MVSAGSDIDEVGALTGVGLGVGAVLSCSSSKQDLHSDRTDHRGNGVSTTQGRSAESLSALQQDNKQA